ncbi:gas vesicle protein GvpO [Actinoallomurus soli]|uniref:gas vesicle protein GvpO n=1 Tax=Actinoallomurus soli TaxID=2952535 RepID=UPI002093749D|nr:gas vesicle protein GvpO [Actinoallomurus soli]MCO5972540.1 gas vesicle protein [Actinoallomurus soli]
MSVSRRDRPERARRRLDDEVDEDRGAEYEAGYDADDEAAGYEEDEPEPRRGRGGAATAGSARLSAGEAAHAALREITALTGRSAEGVVAIRPGESGWVAGVELLEARRVPSSSDTLALYEVEVDEEGGLVAYRRIQRYPRGRGEAS